MRRRGGVSPPEVRGTRTLRSAARSIVLGARRKIPRRCAADPFDAGTISTKITAAHFCRSEDAMPLSQDQRQGKLTTPLGDNTLALMQFSAIEGLSELFEFRIEAASEQGGLD